MRQEYEETKLKLNEIEKEKIDGYILRSKVQWHEEGEKSTKYFFNLEKEKAHRKHIQKLKLSDGTVIIKPNEILNEQKSFYRNLYSETLDINDFEKYKEFFFIQ